LILGSGKAAAFLATFFIPIVLVRMFAPAEFGTYKQIFLIYSTVWLIAQFGMAESLFYFLPSAPHEAGKLISNSLLTLGAAGLLSLAGLVLAGPAIARGLSNPELSAYIPLLGVYLFLMIFGSAMEIIMIARKHYGLGATAFAASDLLRAALFLIPVAFFRSLGPLLWGAVAFAVLRTLYLLSYLLKHFKGTLRPDAALLRRQLGYALPFGLSVLFEIVQGNYHHYAVSHRFGSARFAVYSVGCLQVPLVDFLAAPLASVLMVRMSEMLRQGDDGALLPLWHDAVRKLALIFLPLVACLLMVGRPLILLLFTPAYAASVPIFMVWTLTIMSAVFPTDAVLRVFAATRFLLLLRVFTLVVIVLLIGWAMTTFSLMGAVLVSALASLLTKWIGLRRVRRLLKLPLGDLLPWRSLLLIGSVSVLATVPGLILNSALSGALLLIAGGASYVGLYAALLLGFDLLTSEERAALRAALHRLAAGFTRIVAWKTS
jgi:O-antigen/teichoic acid export membrane protein